VTKADVQVAYSGSAVDTGVMDVRQLAPALMALGALFEESNKVINGDAAKLQVLVRADFERGSFQIKLELVKSLVDTVKSLFDVSKEVNPESIVSFVLGSASCGISLLALLKLLKGRGIEQATILENGNIKITAPGSYDAIEVSPTVVSLYKSVAVRESLKETLEPLKRDGIEAFSVRKSKTETIDQVDKNELGYFEIKENITTDMEPIVTKQDMACSLLSVPFVDDYVWRLSDGESKFSAKMTDENFLKGIQSGSISFSKGDILQIELLIRQFQDANGKLATEKEITRVIKHIKPGKQLSLPF
jgi:hypothetical protein